METKKAFYRMLNQKAVQLAEKVGLSAARIRSMKSDIENYHIYPSTDKMESLLQKAGWKVVQEKLWEEKK